jgi:hypothetical protein
MQLLAEFHTTPFSVTSIRLYNMERNETMIERNDLPSFILTRIIIQKVMVAAGIFF